MAWLAWASRAGLVRVRVLTGPLRVLRTQLTGWDAKVAVEAWNRLYLRGFRPARRSESVSGAKMTAKCYTFQNGDGVSGSIGVAHLESKVLPVSLHRQIPFVSLGEPNYFSPNPASPVVDAIGLPASAIASRDIPNPCRHFRTIQFSPSGLGESLWLAR